MVTRRGAIALAIFGVAFSGQAAAATPSILGPYIGARFKAKREPYTFGQDSSWARNGDVLSAQLDSAGISQVYRTKKLNGHGQRCLTCRTVKGPNGLAQDRPQGDWIMFESYGQQPQHLGGPGLGGYGGDLYVMRENGSHPYRLTTTSDPNDGEPYNAQTGVPYDNFHAYWSPNGRQIIWTHNEANPLSAGGEAWEILLGDFSIHHGVPSLDNVRVVGRPYGAYETQPWAPDGSGFLFSAAGGYRSPFQARPPGWGHMNLYFMRLYGHGASPSHPRVTQISDDVPAYQEQAIFTPDMRTVLMMSNRSSPQDSWYDLIVAAAMRTRFDAPDTGSTQTIQFLADFIGPDFDSDLYAVDVGTGTIRQLTNLREVIPEFFWNHDYTRIIWGLNNHAPGGGVTQSTYTARFKGIDAAERRVPTRIPAPGLYGRRVDMARVGSQAQTIRDPGPTDNASVPVAPPAHPAPPLPHAVKSTDKTTLSAVDGEYLVRWLSDLASLYGAAGSSFTNPPLLSAVPGL